MFFMSFSARHHLFPERSMKFVSVAEDEAMEGCIYGLDYKGEHKYSEGTVVLRALT